MHTLTRFIMALMAVFGFTLIYGGVGQVEMSQDWLGALTGLGISLMGLILMFGSALMSAQMSPEFKHMNLSDQDDVS